MTLKQIWLYNGNKNTTQGKHASTLKEIKHGVA
jgi:hypothetical protein